MSTAVLSQRTFARKSGSRHVQETAQGSLRQVFIFLFLLLCHEELDFGCTPNTRTTRISEHVV
jgi:hypothetical protein